MDTSRTVDRISSTACHYRRVGVVVFLLSVLLAISCKEDKEANADAQSDGTSDSGTAIADDCRVKADMLTGFMEGSPVVGSVEMLAIRPPT